MLCFDKYSVGIDNPISYYHNRYQAIINRVFLLFLVMFSIAFWTLAVGAAVTAKVFLTIIFTIDAIGMGLFLLGFVIQFLFSFINWCFYATDV